ncbi:hypothetical protein OA501_01740 [Flavobacteriaceae bacterium]|nr:hypothetical protein [Flavobacteriaceae bacterium]
MNTSIHVALSVVALAQITSLAIEVETPFQLKLFIFCSTLVAYNFIRYYDLFKNQSLIYTPFICGMLGISFCMLGAGLFCFFFFPFSVQILSLVVGALVLLYALPLGKANGNFRNYGGLKIYLVALSWTLITVGLPSLYRDTRLDLCIWMALIQFVFILVAIQPFDIRDLKLDLVSLNTWPQRFGIRKTKWLGTVLLFLSIVGMFFFSPFSSSFTQPSLLAFLLLLVFLLKSKPNQGRYFSSFWVEGIPLFWWVLYQGIFL